MEVTDKCNLNCPHCYHKPDNKTVADKPMEQILGQKMENDLMRLGAVILATRNQR